MGMSLRDPDDVERVHAPRVAGISLRYMYPLFTPLVTA
jgi:hypothetical protein